MGDSAGTSGTVPILLKRMADQNVGRSAELILPKIVAQLEREEVFYTWDTVQLRLIDCAVPGRICYSICFLCVAICFLQSNLFPYISYDNSFRNAR